MAEVFRGPEDHSQINHQPASPNTQENRSGMLRVLNLDEQKQFHNDTNTLNSLIRGTPSKNIVKRLLQWKELGERLGRNNDVRMQAETWSDVLDKRVLCGEIKAMGTYALVLKILEDCKGIPKGDYASSGHLGERSATGPQTGDAAKGISKGKKAA